MVIVFSSHMIVTELGWKPWRALNTRPLFSHLSGLDTKLKGSPKCQTGQFVFHLRFSGRMRSWQKQNEKMTELDWFIIPHLTHTLTWKTDWMLACNVY